MIRIKKDDLVQVITGKDKGKRGTVIEVSFDHGKIKVQGLAMQTHHVKPRRDGETGGVKRMEGFIDASNVMPICPSTDKPCRVQTKLADSGVRQRVSHRSQEPL